MAKTTPDTPQEQESATPEAASEQQTPDYRQTLMEGQEPEEEQNDQEGNEPVPGSDTGSDPPEDPSADPDGAPEQAEGSDGETSVQDGEESQNGFLEAIRQLGWEGDDEEQAKMALLQTFNNTYEDNKRLQERLAEQEELARYGTEYLKQQREREEAEKKAAQPDSQEPENWWQPPQFDHSVLEKYRDVTLGEDGQPQIGWKKNTPPEIIKAAEDYQQYLDKWATDLVQRPQEVLPRIIEQEFDRLFEQRISQRDQSQQLQTFAQEVKEANKDWMYTQDATGREVLTREGQRMQDLIQEVAEAGVQDPRMQWELAVARYDYQNRMTQQDSTDSSESAKQVAKEKRKQHQQASNVKPNRDGTVPRPEQSNPPPQNPHKTPGQQLVDQLRLDGAEF